MDPNGAGKSTVFFQENSSSTNVAVLCAEGFHDNNTAKPLEITVTFRELSETAKAALKHYVRQDRLVVTTVAAFDSTTGRVPVEQKGERLVFKQFALCSFFCVGRVGRASVKVGSQCR